MPRASKRSSDPDLRRQSSISTSFKSKPKTNIHHVVPKTDPNQAVKPAPVPEVHLKTLREKSKPRPEKSIDENSPQLLSLLNKLSDGEPTTRFHQENLSVGDKVLRLFDLNPDYGPCIGITRLERWNRAAKFGKNPPIEIKSLLESKDLKNEEYSVFGQM